MNRPIRSLRADHPLAMAMAMVALFSTAMAGAGCGVAEDSDFSDHYVGMSEDALTSPSCNESAIRAAAPASAKPFLDRAFVWVHNHVMYNQAPMPGSGAYRADCSGYTSYNWGLSAPGNTTRQFPGGPYDNGKAVAIGWGDLTVGDALNYNSGSEGHVMLFAGWVDSAHTKFCSMEEYDYGHPASILIHSVNETWNGVAFKHLFHPIRKTGYTPGGAPVPPPPSTPPPPAAPSKYWVDTFASAPGYTSPGATHSGTLNQGTNYVFCKVSGPKVQVGSDYNTWWLKTDLDSGSPWHNQYVSAYYLARWGNDIAKDNNGTVIPNCN